MEQNYRIVFKNGDLSFELESCDSSWIQQKEKEYLDRIFSIHTPQNINENKIMGHTKKTVVENHTINEFYTKYLKSKVTSRPDIAVFFIYYLQKISKKEEIKTQDVTQCFADIGYAGYNKLNMTDILNNAKKKALLNYVNSFWSLTITGEDFVLNTIAGEANEKK